MQRQSGRPTAAIVLMSDGIVTVVHRSKKPADGPTFERADHLHCHWSTTASARPALMDLLADDAVYLGTE